MSAIITEKAYVLDQKEHYDYTNNRLRTERHSSNNAGGTLVNIIDFNKDEVFSFVPSDKKCNKSKVDPRMAMMYQELPNEKSGGSDGLHSGHIKTVTCIFFIFFELILLIPV